MMMFGLESQGPTLQPSAIAITIISILAALVAYGILWGKDWAINLGIIYGYIGIATCVASFFIRLNTGGIYIALEPLILIPFIITLKKNKMRWDEFDPNSDEKETISNQRLELT